MLIIFFLIYEIEKNTIKTILDNKVIELHDSEEKTQNMIEWGITWECKSILSFSLSSCLVSVSWEAKKCNIVLS